MFKISMMFPLKWYGILFLLYNHTSNISFTVIASACFLSMDIYIGKSPGQLEKYANACRNL
ncbi:hypothetical protein DWX31_20985 [Hungatella hathewayi]|uniref:Uncharacterized protein n=1 Tax=Hungatella hathewayi TaxID=154046 RepID=A0A3E3DIW0_9FIRM|nr:hypothetical protein DWX31_20985 [Hungatella hathewayi]